MVKAIIVLFGLVIFSGCKNQELVLKRQDYRPDEIPIRLDGFYADRRLSESKGDKNDKYTDILFFYSNSVATGGLIPDSSLTKDLNGAFGKFALHAKSDQTSWGAVNFQGDTIRFEFWQPSPGGGKLKTTICTCKIVNETTFVINHCFSHYRKEERSLQDTFYFHSFSPKPDSTNIYVK